MAKQTSFKYDVDVEEAIKKAQDFGKSLQDIGKDAKPSGEALDAAFSKMAGSIETAFKQVRALYDVHGTELDKLEKAYQDVGVAADAAFNKGNMADVSALQQQQNTLKGEISVRKKIVKEIDEQHAALVALEQQMIAEKTRLDETNDVQVKYTTEKRRLTNELIKMEQAGLRGTEGYEKVRQELASVTSAMSHAHKQAKALAHDQSGFQGVISGLGGMAGGFSAVTGTISLFAGESENLQKIMVKVQSLMAITVGLQQLQQTLNKNSAFNLVTMANLKQWWAKVVEAATVVEKKETVETAKGAAAEKIQTEALKENTGAKGTNTAATGANAVAAKTGTLANLTLAGAFRAVGVAIKSIPVFGWILAGVGTLIGLVSLFTSASRKAAKEAKEFSNAVVEGSYKAVGSIMYLSQQWSELTDDDSKKKFIEDNKKAFDELGVAVNDVADAQKLLIDDKDKFIDAMIEKAKAAIYMQQAMDKVKQLMEVDEQLANQPETIKVRTGLVTSAEVANPALKKLKEQREKLDAEIKQGFKDSADSSAKAIEASKELVTETVKKYAEGTIGAIQEAIQKEQDALKDLSNPELIRAGQQRIKELQEQLEAMTREYAAGTAGAIEAEIARHQKALKSLSDPQAYEEAKKHIELLQKQLATLVGDTSASEAQKKIQADILSMVKEAADQIEEAKINAMQEGQEKRLAILERDHQKEMDRLVKHRDGLIAKLSEEAGHAVELTDAQKQMYDDWAKTITDAYDKAKKAASDFEQIKDKYLSFEQEINAIKQQYAAEEETYLKEREKYGVETAAYQEITEKLIELAKRRNSDLAKLYGEQTSAKMRMIEAERDMDLAAIARSKYMYATDRKRDMLLVQKKAAEQALEELKRLQDEAPTKEIADEIAQITAEIEAMGEEIKKLPAEKFQEVLSGLQGVTNALSGLGGEVGQIFEGMSTAIEGIKMAANDSASPWEKGAAAIQNVVAMINLVAQASANRRQAENQFQQDQIALAHKYALALNEQLRLQSELSGGGFVTDYTGKLKNGFEALGEATSKYHEALEKLSEGKAKIDLKNAVDWGAVGKSAGYGAAAGAMIGSFVGPVGQAIGAAAGAIIGGLVGLFGGKKKKDIFGDLLDVYPELVDGAGQLNQQLAKTLIETNKVDDKTKQILQNALDWADAMAAAKEQMKGVVVELAGDLGDSLKNAMVEAFKAGESASAGMFDAAAKSLEKLVEELLFSTIFSDVFTEFGERLTDALTEEGGNILAEYDWLMEQMGERSEVFFDSLQIMKSKASESGYNMWGMDGDGMDELAKMEAQIEKLKKQKQKTLEGGDENARQLEIEKQRLEIVKELLRQTEELEAERNKVPNIQDSGIVPDAHAIDTDMPVLMDKVAAWEEIAELEASIQKREEEAAKDRITWIDNEIAALEKKMVKYADSLPYIEEQIKLLEEQWGLMTLEERGSDAGKKLIEDRRYFEERRKLFKDMLDEEAEEIAQIMAEGSIAWLDAQISEIDDRLKNFTRDELSSEVGNQLKAQKAEYEQARQEMQDLMSGEVSKDEVEGSRNRINQLLNDAKAQLDAISILDPGNAKRVAEMNETIKGYEAQLAAIDAYISALNEQEKQEQTIAQLIESERAKYDLYQKWLDMYGEEKAKEMLTALLSNADTYIDRLEQGISEIEGKVLAGTATEDDMSLLSNWYSQRKDIYDALAKASEEAAQKALDAWNEAFNESLSEAESAFDKIAVLTKALADLAISGLNDEQIAAQKTDLSKQLLNETKSLEKDLLREFETTAKQRERIEREYNQKIQFLRNEANEGRYEEEAILAEEARDKELSNIEKSILEQSALWKQLFGGDLAKLGKGAAEQALAELRKAVEESVDLTEEARQTILDSLDQVQEDLDQIELDALNKRLEDTKKRFDDISAVINGLNGLISNLGLNTEIGQLAGSLTGVLGGMGEAIVGFGSGNALGGILGVMNALGSIAKIFQWFGAQKENALRKQLQDIQKQYEELEYQVQKSLGGQTAKLQAKQLQNIDQQIAKNLELIAAEKKKLSLFRDKEKINQLEADNIKLLREQQDILEEMANDFLQTDASAFASTLADVLTSPYDSLEDKMRAVEKTSLEMVQNIIKNSLKLRFLEEPVKAAMDELYAKGQDLNDDALQGLMGYINELAARFNTEFEKFAPYFQASDDYDKTMANAIKGITESQANALVAWAANIGINNVERNKILEAMKESTKESLGIHKDMFLLVRGIKEDTSTYLPYLRDIAAYIKGNKSTAAGSGYTDLAGSGYGGAL